MQGGVLYVRPRKAHSLVKKNFFKGGWLHSTATVHASIAGHSKKTAQVDGSNPTFSDVIEFILGTQPALHRSMPPASACASTRTGLWCTKAAKSSTLQALTMQQATSDAVERCLGIVACQPDHVHAVLC